MTNEKITIEEALARGFVYGPLGYNHAAGRTIVAPLKVIRALSYGGAMVDIQALEHIRWLQEDPEPAADIPLVRTAGIK